MGETTKFCRVAVSDLIPYINNAKIHTEDQITRIASSIREFGFLNPVLIDAQKNVIAGHGRIMAAKKLGMTEVPCVYVEGLTDAQRKAYILADNRLAEMADWDMDLVMGELAELDELGFDTELTGFEFEIEPEIIDDEDDVPEPPTEPKAKLGDLYQLGRHRLICGDSTDVNVIDRLMDGVKADMVFTDPPYNVAMQRSASIQNDDLSQEDFEDLLDGAFINAISKCKTQNMYWWIGFRQYSTLEQVFKKHDIDVRNCIVWDKGSIGLGKKGYRYQHELCIFSGEINNNSASDVWKFDRSTEGIHPTMKPIALVANAIKNISDVESVLDVFGGSGSTLIACEQLNRKCYMCELDPKYIDVIIERWENLTGEKAVLLDE